MLEDHHLVRLRATRFAEVRWFEDIGSTNDWVMDQARDGAREGLVAVADHQTEGRGRRDRRWVAPPGSSLLFSVLLRPELSPSQLHLTSAAVALSASAACRAVSGVEPALKWPNDLLVDDRKVAGILSESLMATDAGSAAVVVGTGINVNWPPVLPADLAHLATALNRESGAQVDRAELLVAILENLDDYLDDWAAVAQDYRGRCATVGRDVRVDLGERGTLEGTASGLTDEGLLEVTDRTGRVHTISVGDVVHLRQTEA
ncbi:MAG TPA: biotin--[acetyl-CoA-carboxylase] ligase [Acidimicrobiales bacterium]|nr:biotin--[acetyl-CoA-carboxylase] ligase [Acidimicrobiales bacterium]